jgi:hypothetical protein
MKTLSFLSSLTIKSGIGCYDYQGARYRARAGLTPLGIVQLPEDATEQEEKVKEARDKAGARINGLLDKIARRLGAAKRKPAAPKRKRAKVAVVGLRPDVVTFISEAASGDAATRALAERANERNDRVDRAPNAILQDSISLSVGKQRFLATARTRREQLDLAATAAGLAIEDGHHFEPAPWAAWRASLYHAALKPKRGVHLRYLVGPEGGLAVLAMNNRPLAWQSVARESSKEWFDGLLHAYHVLDLFAVRRLNVGPVTNVSVQGAAGSESEWESLAASVGKPIQRAAGPAYDPAMIAFGAALGALDPATETLNLARDVQDPPNLLSLVPWGEVSLLAVMFVGMFLSLSYYTSDTRQQLETLRARAIATAWAKNMKAADMKKEIQALEKEVLPLKTFVTRDLYFSRSLDSLSQTMPAPTWIAHITAADLIWEKSPNKMLGQRYILINAGAPSETEGEAPPEINDAVRELSGDEYLGKVLPNIKLTDVNWHREAGKSFALFSVLALPKSAK